MPKRRIVERPNPRKLPPGQAANPKLPVAPERPAAQERPAGPVYPRGHEGA